MSKVIESVVHKFILPYVKEKIHRSQFVFVPRSGSGTTSALVLTQHRFLKFLDSQSACVCLLSVDLCKAFDKLPHHVIIDCCYKFHLPISIIVWIFNFLTERFQRVTVDGSISDWVPVPSGVPQGSVLGPLLFAMATDDIHPVLSNTSMIKYADDVIFLHCFRNSIDDNLQDEWDNIVRWSSTIHVPVNISKCCVLNIVTKANLPVKPIVVEDSVTLTQVDVIKFLGVHSTKDLTWNIHVDSAVKKASKRLYIIRNLRRSNCPRELILKWYVAFIRSVLLYSYAAFCNLPDYLTRKLQNVERRAF